MKGFYIQAKPNKQKVLKEQFKHIVNTRRFYSKKSLAKLSRS